ncbi:MAG TPA: helix-turn-helix domain-containing protein [Candidatus Baltobacteraceae bacterium]|nr:helix-turn-helix domain-containing protein [Candidatus Baltobacteraceae bacterium]
MRRVIFPIVERFEIFDLAGPLQVLHEANLLGAGYELVFAALGRTVEASQGIAIAGLQRLPRANAGDLIVIPGSGAMREAKRREQAAKLVTWLRESHDRGARIASVCVGAFLLGQARLLDGRNCTTHWKRAEELARRFPRAHVLRDRLFVFDGPIVTSAGIAAGVDMTLALVEADCGARMVAQIAREMVLHVRRQGAQAQLNPLLGHRDHLEAGVHAVQDRILSRPQERHSLEALAGVAGVSRRHLTRLFREATGISVSQYHTGVRLEHARTLLANPDLTIEAVAQRCGLSDARQLRRLWKEKFGANPRDARTSA